MPSTRTEITVLLMIEAMDKASSLIGNLGATLDGMSQKLRDMSGAAILEGDELEAAQLKAVAAEDAHRAALDAQMAAMDRLKITTQSLRDAQAQLAAVEEGDAKAASDAARVISAASADQVAALDAVRKAEDLVGERATYMADAQKRASTESTASGIGLKQVGGAAVITAAAVAGIGYESVKAAANFQAATTVLMTSGGQTTKTIDQARQSILSLSSSTGTSTQQLINAMYQIGSAGIKTSLQYDTLKAAAEGAKAENADLGVTANALTTIMVDYGNKIQGGPIQAMNMMISAVTQGKMTTQDFASSLSSVLPIANSAGLSFDQVAGAIAAMTRQGMSAQQSTMDLAHMIGQLQKPNQQAIQMMQQMGIDSNALSTNLGKNGLTGTMDTLLQAIANNTHGGKIMLNDWYNSAAAAKDLKQMVGDMTPSMQSLANAFLNGSLSAKTFRTDIYALPPLQRNVMNQFMTLADKADGFNQMLKAGNPDAMTFNAALSTMLGGQVSLKTALMLSSNQGKDFKSIVAQVGAASQNTGKDVNGWSLIQQTMNQKLAELKSTVNVVAIELGTVLLPIVTKMLDWILKIVTPIANWIDRNKTLAGTILAIIGILSTLIAIFVGVMKVITLVRDAWIAFQAIMAATEFNPVVLAITAVALAAMLIITNWSTVKRWLEEFWHWLTKIISEAWSFIKSHMDLIAGAIALLGGPVGAIIALAIEIIAHWDTVKKWFAEFWNIIKQGASEAAAFLKRIWSDIAGAFESAWDATVSFFKRIWGDVAGWFKGIWSDISKPLMKEWEHIKSDLESIWQSLKTIWNATAGKLIDYIADNWHTIEAVTTAAWQTIYNAIMDVVNPIVNFLRASFNTIKSIATTVWRDITGIIKITWDFIFGLIKSYLDMTIGRIKAAWDVLQGIFHVAWDLISGIVKAAWDVIVGIVQGAITFIEGVLKAGWNIILDAVKAVWDAIKAIINLVLDALKDILKLFADFVTGQWNKLWGDVEKIFKDAWNNVWGFFKEMGSFLLSFVKDLVGGIWGAFIKGIGDALGGIGKALKQVWNAVISAFADAGKWLYNAGRDVLNGLIGGLESMWNDVKGFFDSITSAITSWKGPPSRDKILLVQNGQFIMQGLITGIDSQVNTLKQKLGQVTGTVTASINPVVGGAANSISSLASRGQGGVVINNTFPNAQIAGPNSINWIIQQINKQLVQRAVPSAGVQITRATY